MKKLFSKAIGTVLTLSLVAGGLPVSVNAATIQGGKNADFLKTAESLKNTNDKEKIPYVEGEVIVLNTSKKTAINAFKKEASSLGVQVVETCNFDTGNGQDKLQMSLVKSDKYTTEELMKQFKASGTAKMVQPNYKYYATNVDETLYNERLWGVNNQEQNAGTFDMDINSDSENVKPAQGESEKEKVIAVIDTGVDYNHTGLQGAIWNNSNTVRLKGEHGYDFCNLDADPMDDNGHGTHCAGIIKSVMNDNNIKIMPVKFLNDEGSGDTYSAVAAYNYIYTAQKLGVNVVAINNSWGGYFDEADYLLQSMINLVGKNGAISVCAAGNEASCNDEIYVSPASLDSPYIISVAATNEKGELAQFSNYGINEVDIAAPGTDILSTVGYECFNPSVYSEESKQKLCSTYQDFSGNLVTPDVPGSMKFETASEDSVCYALEGGTELQTQTVSLTSEDFFGKKTENAKALQWDIKNAKAEDEYILYLPYYQESSTTPVHVNFMVKTSSPETSAEENSGMLFAILDAEVGENGEIDEDSEEILEYIFYDGTQNYWDQISFEKASKVKKAGQRAMAILVCPFGDGDYQIKLDDFAVSKGNVATEEFGRTAYYNGTSMATPYVAGAIASMANAYPEDSVEERIGRVKGSVRKMENLTDKVASGGILDLSKSNSPAPVVEDVTVNEEGKLEISGKFFTEAEVQINGKSAAVQSQSKEKVIVEGDYFNQVIRLDVKMGDTTFSKECYCAKGEKPEKVANLTENFCDSSLVSDGTTLYCVDTCGNIYSFMESALTGEMYSEYADMNYLCFGLDTNKLFGDSINYAVIESQAVCLNSELYAIAALDNEFSRTEIIIKFDWETFSWEKVTNVPDGYSNIESPDGFNGEVLSAFASYNGKLYVLGGIDTNTNQPCSSVYAYDVAAGKWSKEASMPEVRYASKAIQSGDKLVVTLGGNGTEECPVNLIYDGTNWSTSKAEISGMKQEKCYNYDGKKENALTYYDGEIGVVQNGLIYTGFQADGVGDTFIYQMKEDNYISTGYSIKGISEEKEICAASMGNGFYVFTGNTYDSYFDGMTDTEENTSAIYRFDISNGQCLVNGNMPEGGVLYGLGSYMPGATVEIGAEPWENYYLKSLKVNGENVNAGKTGYSTVISNITSDVSVDAEFAAYVAELQLDTTNISMAAGSKQKLNVQILPENAENQALQFKSSNKQVVTVDSKGNLKANKNAAGKSATITITAKDRNTVVATCKVKVRKPVKVKKLKLSTEKNVKKVKAGKTLNINTKITPANADNQELVWTSSNTKYATVKNGMVKGKKAGIGKKVTITAKTKDGSKVKASIQIKIVK